MGQKTNSNILRLNYNKSHWKLKYYAKTHEEFSLYTYNILEIKKLLNRIFQLYGLIIKNMKFYYSNDVLKIFISFFLTRKYFQTRKKLKKVYCKKYNFSETILESLNLFIRKKLSINILLQNLNKGCSVRFKNNKLKLLKKNCLKLRKFAKADFFSETINILIITLRKKSSSKLLSDFLAIQIQALKKQKFFIIALKQILYILLDAKLFSTKGIKILIKGRINGVRRTKINTINIGNTPLHAFEASINYSVSTVYTRNGTFGVKVWIHEIS